MPSAPARCGHHGIDRNDKVELSHPATKFVQIWGTDVDPLDLRCGRRGPPPLKRVELDARYPKSADQRRWH